MSRCFCRDNATKKVKKKLTTKKKRRDKKMISKCNITLWREGEGFISILIMNAICPFTLMGEYEPTMNKTYWLIPPLIRFVWCVSQAVIPRRQKVILYVGFGRVIFSVLPFFFLLFYNMNIFISKIVWKKIVFHNFGIFYASDICTVLRKQTWKYYFLTVFP